MPSELQPPFILLFFVPYGIFLPFPNWRDEDRLPPNVYLHLDHLACPQTHEVPSFYSRAFIDYADSELTATSHGLILTLSELDLC